MPPKDPNPAGPAPMMIPVDDLTPSPLNPRKRPRDIAELAVSVKARGVLSPLLVRTVRDGELEIVAGERRWRAAKEAGLAEVPATVRDIDDVTVIELGVEENCQRNDLTASEEADAFAELEKRGRSVDQISSLAGRSTQYVRQRMRLRQLVPGLRDLLNAERLDVGGALVLAQLPPDEQKKILPELLRASQAPSWERRQQGAKPSAEGHISRGDVQQAMSHFAHDLAGAPFDPEDAELVPDAGKCSVCPRQTGRQGVLFETLDRAAVCLDRECFDGKVRASWAVKSAEAKKRGLKVLTVEQSKKQVEHGRGAWNGNYVALDEEKYVDGKRVKVADVVDAKAPRVLALCPDTGKPVELVSRTLVEPKRSASKKPSSSSSKAGKTKGPKAPTPAELLKKRHTSLALATIAGAVTSQRLPVIRALRLLISEVVGGCNELEVILARRGVEEPATQSKNPWARRETAIREEAVRLSEIKDEKLAVRNLVALLCEVFFSEFLYSMEGRTPDRLQPFGVDFAKLKKVAEQELKDEAKAAAAEALGTAPSTKLKAAAKKIVKREIARATGKKSTPRKK